MNENKGQIQTVPMASFEASQSRHSRIVRALFCCWFSSVAVMGAAVVAALVR